MRAPSFLLVAVVVKLSSGALFGAPLVMKKRAVPPPVPVSIVSKGESRTTLDTERVELDVRHTTTVVDEPEAPSSPTPTTKTRAVSAPPAVKSPEATVGSAGPPPFAALVSARVDELPMCRRGGPDGPGVAEVVFLPEGGADVKLSQPYANTETGACVARRLGRDARAFTGEPVAVRVRFSL